MSDAEAITALSSLKGIGKWTAEMILLFCLQQPVKGKKKSFKGKAEKYWKYILTLSGYSKRSGTAGV